MAFAYTNSKGRTYYLHAKEVALRGGRQQTIYYFSKEVKPGALHVLPSGKIVVENGKTGLPILKGSEKPTNIGRTEVLTGSGIKLNGQVNLPQKPETTNNSVTVAAQPVKEEKVKVEEAASKENLTKVSATKNKKKLSILPLAMLPGQLFLVAVAKLLMYAANTPGNEQEKLN